MKTAQDVITEIQKLTPDQMEEVFHFVVSIMEQQEEFSEEDTALILEAREDAKRGINMSGPFVGEEAINHLQRLRKVQV
ncbi:MAG: hypothetical protein C4527_25280 [Candidatus Omnitrophota bacterium]|nr:MAG: hypothetical protein C4527_25280 [Candidatus Omnitrophota bacterium]